MVLNCPLYSRRLCCCCCPWSWNVYSVHACNFSWWPTSLFLYWNLLAFSAATWTPNERTHGGKLLSDEVQSRSIKTSVCFGCALQHILVEKRSEVLTCSFNFGVFRSTSDKQSRNSSFFYNTQSLTHSSLSFFFILDLTRWSRDKSVSFSDYSRKSMFYLIR